MKPNHPITIFTSADTSYFQVCIVEFVQQAKEYYNLEAEKVADTHDTTLKTLRFLSKYITIPRLARKKQTGEIGLSVQIGPDFAPIYKQSLKGGANYMYFFDCWLPNIPWVIEFSRIFAINTIFFSTKQAAETFFEQGAGKTQCKAVWVPEGFKAEHYNWLPTQEKTIDVLEFGRKYDQFHNSIKEPLAQAGFKHAYPEPGKLLFPEEKDFVAGLAKSKISICFPSSITHPERAGIISTMTLRYLQSMASKCLIVGKLPYDMQFLFDYNPVVEIEEANAGEQIVDILNNFDQYQNLIEKNYQMVIDNHQWKNRIAQIIKHIQA